MQLEFHNWEDKTILVAEDEDMNFFLIQEVFRKSKAKLIRAVDGQQAIDLFKKNPNIDLILMDVNMPELTGYEATKIIKKIRNVPIIVQTAYVIVNEKVEKNKFGFDDYITKPIKISKLLFIVGKFLNKSK